MLGYINYKIDTQYKVVFINMQNEINIDIIEQTIDALINDPKYSASYDTLIDMQSCDLKIKHDELNRIIHFLDINPKLNSNRNSIYLTNKPNEVVITTLYCQLLKNTNIKPHTISTIKAAQLLLSNYIEIEQIEQILNSIKNRE